MTKTAKVLLGVGGVLILLAVVGIVVLIVGMNYLEKRLTAGSKAETDAGVEFAKTVDQQGCMTEGLKRSKTMGFLNVSQGMSLSVFVESCLKSTKPTQDFCAGVPGFWSFEKSDWMAAECQKIGLDPQKTGCIYVYTAKHNVCSPPN